MAGNAYTVMVPDAVAEPHALLVVTMYSYSPELLVEPVILWVALFKLNTSGKPESVEVFSSSVTTRILTGVPGHTAGFACGMVTVGSGFTVTLTLAMLEQPVAVFVTVSV